MNSDNGITVTGFALECDWENSLSLVSEHNYYWNTVSGSGTFVSVKQ